MTLVDAETLLTAWTAAELAVATGQSYRIGNRELTRADAALIVSQRAKWGRVVASMKSGRNGGIDVFRIMPRDF